MPTRRYKVKYMPTRVGGFWRVYNHKRDHIANFFTLPEAVTYATQQARTRMILLPTKDVVTRDPLALEGQTFDAGDAGFAWLPYTHPTREDLTNLATALLRHAETLT